MHHYLELNDPVRITRKPLPCAKDTNKFILYGEVAYLGRVSFAGGDNWVGVRLTGNSIGYGENNGIVNGKQYFLECATNGGLFVRSDKVRLDTLDYLTVLRSRREKKCLCDKLQKSRIEAEHAQGNFEELRLKWKTDSIQSPPPASTDEFEQILAATPPDKRLNLSLTITATTKEEKIQKENEDSVPKLNERYYKAEAADSIVGIVTSGDTGDTNNSCFSEEDEASVHEIDSKTTTEESHNNSKFTTTKYKSQPHTSTLNFAETQPIDGYGVATNTKDTCVQPTSMENPSLLSVTSKQRKILSSPAMRRAWLQEHEEVNMTHKPRKIIKTAKISFKKIFSKLKCATLERSNETYPSCITHDPPLGISVHALRHILLPEVKQAGLHETSTIYDIEDLRNSNHGIIRKKGAMIKCPRDGIIGAAYVDCLNGVNNVGPSKRMLSYTWGDSIGDIIDSLDAYCESNNEDPKQMYIWICCLCNNLHRYNPYSPFQESVFQDTVIAIGHLVAKRLGKLSKYIDLVKFLTSISIVKTKASKDNDKFMKMKLANVGIGVLPPNKNVAVPLQDYVQEMIMAAVDECEQQSGHPKIDLEYAKLCDDVGRIMHQYGKYDEAIVLYNKCLAVFKKVCGEDHVDTAISYSNIGSVMVYKCDYDKALDMFRKCLKVKEKIYGVEHYDTATTYNNIALVMMKTSDYHGAMTMFEKALIVDEKLCGQEHPDTATSYNNIGVMKNKMGDLDGAILMYKKCLAVEEKVYGKEHHVTANSYNNIAAALGEKCNYKEALEMHRKSLRVLVKIYGKDQEDVIKTKIAIAEIKKTLG